MIDELDTIGFQRLAISSISVAEIYYGMRKKEKRKTKELLEYFDFIHVDKETSQMFLQIMLGYNREKVAIPDALIAATAIVNQVHLFTLNVADFDYIEGMKLYKSKK